MHEILNVFRQDNAAMWNWLNDNRESNSFAGSLFDQLQRKGSLSERQLDCIRNNLKGKAKQEGVAIKGSGLSELLKAFEHAKAARLKRPRLRIQGLVFTIAGASSVNAGCLYVKSESSDYLGRITPSGQYFASRDADEQQRALVAEVGVNPLKNAVAHGQQTGNCACCGRELTKKESIDRGIGPVCAGKWGW